MDQQPPPNAHKNTGRSGYLSGNSRSGHVVVEGGKTASAEMEARIPEIVPAVLLHISHPGVRGILYFEDSLVSIGRGTYSRG